MALVSVGNLATDFVLKDQFGQDFILSAFRGKNVLLSFHPLAWTSVCTGQMKSLEENYQRLTDLETTAVGISVDSVPCKKAWAEHLDLRKTRLLSDFWPHGDIALKYGNFRTREGTAGRANVVVDKEGNVVFAKQYEIATLPDMGEIVSFLQDSARKPAVLRAR